MAPSRSLPPSDAWLERLLQLLHDPPGKVKYLPYHKKLSKELAEAISGLCWTDAEWRAGVVNRPDAAAAGADRPAFAFGTRQPFNRVERQLVTHPLERAEDTPPLLLASSEGRMPEGKQSGIEERQAQREVARRLAERELAADGDVEGAFYRVWRRFCADLISHSREEAGPEGVRRDLFWSAVPSETRCPDVSIWDHTRVASALSFMNMPTSTKALPTALPAEREPWLVQFSLSGIQSFIRTARTTRDLWIGSFLLSDLAFSAMLPIIEQYGPTAILYPDLRGNPRMDAWLDEAKPQWNALRKDLEPSLFGTDATSFAAVVPNSFVAVVPLGGGEFPNLRELADKAKARVQARWKSHADAVQKWLASVVPATAGNSWKGVWERQHRHADVVRVRWTAVPWVHAPRMKAFVQSGALPFQDASQLLPQETEEDRALREQRTRRFTPWVSEAVWTHVEKARYAFGRTNANLFQMERGFDYGITNAQLRAVHQVRKQSTPWAHAVENEQAGVACTLCGQRMALSVDTESQSEHVDSLTHWARTFWSNEELDPEKRGAERLCAVCSMKRFLVVAGGAEQGINRLWANDDDRKQIRESKARVPFPSTTAICAQRYIATLCATSDPKVAQAIERVVNTHRALGLPATQFPHCLRQLAETYDRLPEGDVRRDFLMREPQEMLYPQAMEARVAAAPGQEREQGNEHVRAICSLLQVVKERLHLAPPPTRLAVIKVDGDALSHLLTGEPDRLHARWRDVIHPELVEKLEAEKDVPWSSLLDAKRLVGPTLHAFVTRALGAFAHRIAPWVVEQEFHGRLIYAGGDDVLALAPADEALLIVARLQQLLSAAWIVDVRPDMDAWAWRRMTRKHTPLSPEEARARFRIPVRPSDSAADKALQLPAVRVERHVAEAPEDPVRIVAAPPSTQGPVIPMLGHGQSLSAGIVYAHLKASLGSLVDDAERLNEHAKEHNEHRGAVAMAWRTRNGEKLRFVMPWKSATGPGPYADQDRVARRSLVHTWQRVVAAFAYRAPLRRATSESSSDDVRSFELHRPPGRSEADAQPNAPKLSGSLPYKLREKCAIVSVLAERLKNEPERLRASLNALVEITASDLCEDVVALWLEGLSACAREGVFPTERSHDEEHRSESIDHRGDRAEHATDGLAICRALASNGSAEGRSS